MVACLSHVKVYEAIVESWGSIIGMVICEKIANKESIRSDMIDINNVKTAFKKVLIQNDNFRIVFIQIDRLHQQTYNRFIYEHILSPERLKHKKCEHSTHIPRNSHQSCFFVKIYKQSKSFVSHYRCYGNNGFPSCVPF